MNPVGTAMTTPFTLLFLAANTVSIGIAGFFDPSSLLFVAPPRTALTAKPCLRRADDVDRWQGDIANASQQPQKGRSSWLSPPTIITSFRASRLFWVELVA